MRSIHFGLAALGGLLSFSSGCSLVLDGGRHRGASADGGVLRDADAPRSDGAVGDASPPDGSTALADAPPPTSDAGACDVDGDGHIALGCGGDDCDDGRAEVYPGAPPICGSGRAESCGGDGLAPLLALLGAEELGPLPRVVVARDVRIAPDVAAAVVGSGDAGTASVMYRERGASGYTVQVVPIDLGSGRTMPLPGIADGLFVHGVGGGDLGGTSERMALAAAASTPDAPNVRALRFEAYRSGGSGSSTLDFGGPAARSAAVVGVGDGAESIAVAFDGGLVRYRSADASVLLVEVDPLPFRVAGLYAEGAGPFAHFRGNGSYVWDLSEPACEAAAACASGACEAGRCLPPAPRRVAPEVDAGGSLDLAYREGTLWFAQQDLVDPDAVAVGTLDCGGEVCTALSRGEVSLDARVVLRATVAPLADDLVAIVAAASTDTANVVRAAFHRPSDGRQLAPFDFDLFALDAGDVTTLYEARSTHFDPRLGWVTQVVVVVAQPTSDEPVVAGGIRICESS
jgi:hypothetical protein